MPKRTYGKYSISTSNEDKVLFPSKQRNAPEITKGMVIDYYEAVADVMLPHLKDRPLVMQRWPDGITREGFYQKSIPDYFPEWITRVTVTKEGGEQTLVVADRTATLAYLANQACLTMHSWLSRTQSLNNPDQLILDLDPPGDHFDAVREAALRYRQLLDELQVASYLKTTGSKGLHVIVPLDGSIEFDTVREFARAIVQLLAERFSDSLTVEQRKNKRQGRVYLDVGRNAYAQTAVAPYSLRARPGATVATPLHWDELKDKKLHAQSFTISNILKRIETQEDPWSDMRRRAVSISAVKKRLDKYREAHSATAEVNS